MRFLVYQKGRFVSSGPYAGTPKLTANWNSRGDYTRTGISDARLLKGLFESFSHHKRKPGRPDNQPVKHRCNIKKGNFKRNACVEWKFIDWLWYASNRHNVPFKSWRIGGGKRPGR